MALAFSRFEGSAAIFAAQVLRLFVRIASAALLARLLTPEAYGLYGMAAVVFGLLYIARDLGVITAMQQPGVTPQHFNALCRIGAVGGVALAVTGAALALPVGRFYGEPDSVPLVLAVMSGAFVFTGLAAPALGQLYREQRAGLVALLETIAMAIGASVAVFAAWRGAGVWALVLMNLGQEFTACVLAWAACRIRPGRDVAGIDWRGLAAFGANFTGYNLVTHCTRLLDHVAVGRTAGAAALGLYGRGAQIVALPVQFGLGPFTPWILATLAAKREAPASQVEFFRGALNSLLHVSLAAAAVCIALPDRLLLVLFGEAWLPAVPVVRWLGVALAVQPWLSAPVWLLSAYGEIKRLLIWSLAGLGLMLAACGIAYRHGPASIALAAAIATVVHAALGPAFCAARTPVTVRDWLAAAGLPAATHGIFLALLLTLDRQRAADAGTISRFVVPIAVAAGYYGFMFLACPPFRRDIRRHLFWTR